MMVPFVLWLAAFLDDLGKAAVFTLRRLAPEWNFGRNSSICERVEQLHPAPPESIFQQARNTNR
jgi:hypothetical protein